MLYILRTCRKITTLKVAIPNMEITNTETHDVEQYQYLIVDTSHIGQ